MRAYGVTDWGPNDKYDLKDPSLKQVKEASSHLIKRYTKNLDQSFVIFYLFACHGIHRDGQQAVVINEFDSKKEFY